MKCQIEGKKNPEHGEQGVSASSYCEVFRKPNEYNSYLPKNKTV
jgi:hypothetical protein